MELTSTDKSEVRNVVTDLLAGTVGGMAGIFVGHPLDTVRVRLQSSRTATEYRGVFQAAIRTVRYEGPLSLFKGLASPLIANAPLNALVFAGYGQAMRYMETVEPSTGINTLRLGVAGAWGGLLQCIIATPSELIKCQQQVYIKGSFRLSAWRVIKERSKHLGVFRGLFQGWWTTVWRDVPSFAVYFITYEWTKRLLNDLVKLLKEDPNKVETPTQAVSVPEEVDLPPESSTTEASEAEDAIESYLGIETHSVGSASPTNSRLPSLEDTLVMLVSGSVSGVLTWGSTYPFDVLKTNVQTKPLHAHRNQLKLFSVARELIHTSGWTALYRGLAPTLVRSIPTNAVTFLVYEFSLSLLNN
eukprot:gb/GECG01014602.1/.p1 GENE.gb/GECG01014602.1/~~gb/GECG01014602.1/.p1  ORF type:complete len:358 (+),score=26.08 gb/GECG01014602.1/:1-1074(+)